MEKLFKGLKLLLLALVTFNIVMFAKYINQQELLAENAQDAAELAKARSAIFEKKLKDSALQIMTDVGRGSAIYIDKGIAISARHVCEIFEKAKVVYLVDAEKNKMAIDFYEIPPKNKDKELALDLCVIKFQPKMKYMPVTRIAKGRVLNMGTKLFNPNYGGGEFYSLRIGEVIAEESLKVYTDNCMDFGALGKIGCEKYDLYEVKRTSVPGVPGASGSGLITPEGELVGILVLGAGDNSWSGIVPLNVLKEYLDRSILFGLAFNPK